MRNDHHPRQTANIQTDGIDFPSLALQGLGGGDFCGLWRIGGYFYYFAGSTSSAGINQ